MCGCALRSLGTPCVAQRVWAMPILPWMGVCVERILQRLNLADRAQARQVVGAIEDGDAGRVVAPILEPPQSLHQDGNDVPLGDCSDDSAHDYRALVAARGGSPGRAISP